MSDDGSSRERADLVRRAQAGDAAAFAEIARRSGRAVYAIALSHVGRPADAEDVAQSVLLAALENIDACRDPSSFDSWLFTIARNRARRALVRRKLRDVLAGPPEEAPERSADPVDVARREALLRALSALPSRSREVVLLHDLEGYSHPEIASALSITEEASRQHLSRARRQMRAELEEEEDR